MGKIIESAEDVVMIIWASTAALFVIGIAIAAIIVMARG